MRGAVDDMLGRFEKTSEAYRTGFEDGSSKMKRAILTEIERLVWEAERNPNNREEFESLVSVLGKIRDSLPERVNAG